MRNGSSDNRTAPSQSPSSSSAGDSYIGSFISLTSKYEIRYEGVLYYLNPQDSTLGLKNVKSYGTEGRKKDGPQIPPSDKVYEYILFRGSDIKDLQVKPSPPPQVEEPIHNDPAIIQSQFAAGPSSSSKPVPVGGGSLTEFSTYMEATAPNMGSYPSVLLPQQSGAQVGAHGPSQIPLNTNFSSHAMPMPGKGYSGAMSGNAFAQQHQNPSANTLFSTLQNFVEASPMPASTPINLPSLSTNLALSFTPAVLKADALSMYPLPSSAQNVNKSEAANIDQLQPRLPEIASTQRIFPVQKDMSVLNSASSSSLSAITNPVIQAPLLPSQPPRQELTEEFDFEAMNEKFKKDELWGYLGKVMHRDNLEGVHYNTTVCQTSGDEEGDGMTTEADSKPAYNKDDFFDSISCNTTAQRGRNVPNRFSERMKQDTETFGQFQQRSHPVYGGHRAGRGLDRNPYGWGRWGGYMRQ